MSDIKRIIEDPREIETICFGRYGYLKVGEKDVSKIEPYEENGQMAKITWLAVYNTDGELQLRMNSADVIIEYKVEEEDKP